jgi:hypothetical protein
MDMTPEDWISFSDQGPSQCKGVAHFKPIAVGERPMES